MLITTSSSVAAACGGFACDLATPIVQSGEQVVVAIDEPRGVVDMHVRVQFEGESPDFAWIVPVPGVPELRLSTEQLFAQVAFPVAPSPRLNVVEEGHCRERVELPFGGVEYALSAGPGDALPTTIGGVYVLDERGVGPYDTVTLGASSADVLLDWLQAEGYDLPDGLADVLQPYLADGQHFVALKLANDADAGDLQPLALRFPGTRASIPIQLTAVSTIDDLPVQVYVLSGGRAVPESYLHARLNPAAIDWWSFGGNWNRLIGRAADEAGGQAFVTQYHGPSDVIPAMWDEGSYSESAMRATTGFVDWLTAVREVLTVATPELFVLVEELGGLDPGEGSRAVGCPTCFDDVPIDGDAATDLLVERVVEPLRTVQELLDRHRYLTSMATQLSAFEMTTDPVFVVNHDLTDDAVDNVVRARLTRHCANGRLADHAKQTLRLTERWQIELESDDWYDRHGTDPFRSLGDVADVAALVVEQMGPDGEPSVLVDRTDELLALTDEHNRGVGCRTAPGAGAALLPLLAFYRRGRRGFSNRTDFA